MPFASALTPPALTTLCPLSLPDALPIFHPIAWSLDRAARRDCEQACDDLVLATGTRPSDYADHLLDIDRKSTRLNSSHRCISYAVFCLKKKKSTEYEGSLFAKGECVAYG